MDDLEFIRPGGDFRRCDLGRLPSLHFSISQEELPLGVAASGGIHVVVFIESLAKGLGL